MPEACCHAWRGGSGVQGRRIARVEARANDPPSPSIEQDSALHASVITMRAGEGISDSMQGSCMWDAVAGCPAHSLHACTPCRPSGFCGLHHSGRVSSCARSLLSRMAWGQWRSGAKDRALRRGWRRARPRRRRCSHASTPHAGLVYNHVTKKCSTINLPCDVCSYRA